MNQVTLGLDISIKDLFFPLCFSDSMLDQDPLVVSEPSWFYQNRILIGDMLISESRVLHVQKSFLNV